MPTPSAVELSPDCDAWLEPRAGGPVLVIGTPFLWWLRVSELRGLLAPVIAGLVSVPFQPIGFMAVMADGRHSVTHYETLEAHRFASLLEIHLETGRTHQIRVHMAALKHPCVGDLTYGADPSLAKRVGLERQWLHAVRLGFDHPDSGEYVEFESDYPADLAHALEVIRDAD